MRLSKVDRIPPLSGLLAADEVNSHMNDYDFAVLALERILDAIDKLVDAAEVIVDAIPDQADSVNST